MKGLFLMFSKNSHIHFIGISGIGMSGIAKILLQQGYTVSGCDISPQETYLQELKNLGCTIASSHLHETCKDSSIDYIVHTTDIPLSHPELRRAQENNITIVHRATMLAEIMRTKFALAVAGSHGKTTTTSLATHLFLQLQANPSFVIGGHLTSQQTNAAYNSGDLIIAEADESDRSFLKLPKTWSIVTNIDLEHLETYKNFDDVLQTFVTYMNQIPFYGKNIVCIDDKGIKQALPLLHQPAITYGTDPRADIMAYNVQLQEDSSTFTIIDKRTNIIIEDITMPLPGMHNVLNATSVVTLALHLGFQENLIKQAVASFAGVDRRFTFKGITKKHQAVVIDDYGHHPEEIRNTILVARKKTTTQLCMVFQPHRHTRTYHLWQDFINVLSSPDLNHLIITDIFAKGEPEVAGFTSKQLALEIQKRNPAIKVIYIPLQKDSTQPFGTDILAHLHTILQPQDLLLLQGAGKINQLAYQILQ